MGWFKRLKNWLFSKVKKQEPISIGYGEAEPAELRWGIIVPHESKRPGAYNYDKTISEYNYGLVMCKSLPFPCETRDSGGVYGAAKKLKAKGVNATLEPHYNAFNGKASGCEILVLAGDKESERVARLILNGFKQKYPHRILRGSDGIKFVSKGDRGYYNLVNAKSAGSKIRLLSELFFGDNKSDYMKPEDQADFWKEHLGDKA